MNYQGNIDAYYSYAKENRQTSSDIRKKVYTWLLLLMFIGFLIWAYFNIFNMGEIKNLKGNTPQLEHTEKVESFSKEEKKKVVIKNISEVKKVVTPLLLSKPNEILKGSSLSEVNDATSKISMAGENLKLIDMNTSILKVGAIIVGSKILEANTSVASKGILSDLNKTTAPISLYHLYIVQKGETLYDIAKKQYNDTSMYIEIIKANPDFDNPNNIKAGEELLLPIVDESKNYSQVLNFK